MTLYTVRVTKKLIHWALTQSSTQCAIAQAVRDANDEWERPWVNQKSIGFSDHATGTRYNFPTPQILADWISQFDADPTQVKPITFEIDVVKESVVKRGDTTERQGASVLRVKSSPRATPQEVNALVKSTQRSSVQQRIADHARYTSGAMKKARGAISHRPIFPGTAA